MEISYLKILASKYDSDIFYLFLVFIIWLLLAGSHYQKNIFSNWVFLAIIKILILQYFDVWGQIHNGASYDEKKFELIKKLNWESILFEDGIEKWGENKNLKKSC